MKCLIVEKGGIGRTLVVYSNMTYLLNFFNTAVV